MKEIVLSPLVIPGYAEGVGPESMTTGRGYGFRAHRFAAPRNDDGDVDE
jgi:hypothetical protein